MSDLNIKEMKINEARQKNLSNFDVSLKEDGTLMNYVNKNLVSPRIIIRNERFPHIKKILDENNFPSCFGEMFIEGKGTNVFDVSSKENWHKSCFMPIDLIDNRISYVERQKIISNKIKELNSKGIKDIKPLIRFKTFDEGWKYVLDNDEEGLVIRNKNNPSEWFKIKVLKEIKLKIIGWESSKDKGTFILENGSRISGTSIGFVKQYQNIIESGGVAIAECEYAFLTKKDNKMFQPRLRRVGTAKEIL